MKNVSRFLADRMSNIETAHGSNMARPAVKIAKLSMIIGLTIMLLSVAIVLGFKKEVREQVIGFGGHIQISQYINFFEDDESNPIDLDNDFISKINSVNGVRKTQPIALSAAMIKTDDDFKGVILKGVDSLYDWDFFSSNMVEGTIFSVGDSSSVDNGAIISRLVANKLGVSVGDRITMYFFKDRMRARRLTITGIYATSFLDYDNTYVLANASVVQKINSWENNQYSMLEILVDNYDNLSQISDNVFVLMGNIFSEDRMQYMIKTIDEVAPVLFNWLDMLDVNTIVILVLMILVSGFCMISGLLIIILERRETIGVLKALGASNIFIRKIFLWQSVQLISRSMLWGNLLGLLFIFIEWQWHLIPLDPVSYYVNYVPVFMSVEIFIGLNLMVFIVSVLMMIVPTYFTTRISPIEAMRAV